MSIYLLRGFEENGAEIGEVNFSGGRINGDGIGSINWHAVAAGGERYGSAATPAHHHEAAESIDYVELSRPVVELEAYGPPTEGGYFYVIAVSTVAQFLRPAEKRSDSKSAYTMKHTSLIITKSDVVYRLGEVVAKSRKLAARPENFTILPSLRPV